MVNRVVVFQAELIPGQLALKIARDMPTEYVQVFQKDSHKNVSHGFPHRTAK